MAQNFGIESPGAHHPGAHRAAGRYLVVIDAAGESLARLFDAAREPLASFDAGTEEVAVMTRGLSPTRSAGDAAWDLALAGHSSEERSAAEVYLLEL